MARYHHWLRIKYRWLALSLVVLAHVGALPVHAQYESRQVRQSRVEKALGEPPNMKRLTKSDRVWVDKDKHLVVVDGYVAMRQGQLEMFACPAGTKEHESVVGVLSKAQFVHAALLAAGAVPGKPVQWEPSFQPPTGSEIEIRVLWFDKDGKKQATDARKWIRQLGTDNKTLESNWVFAGSSMWKDPDTGEEKYMAESGDLVCISNFTTATLDVPFQSSQANSGLLFAANTDAIPAEGTPVRLVFKVIQPKSDKPPAAPAVSPASASGTPPAASDVKPAGSSAEKEPNKDQTKEKENSAKESIDLLTPIQ